MTLLNRTRRLWEIGRTARRFGLDAELEPVLKFRYAPQVMRLLFGESDYNAEVPFAVRFREALSELGPIFVKFGQIMSTRPDIFPEDVIDELKLLQDQVPAFGVEEAKSVIEKSLGMSIDSVFESFDDIPVASASVAQVHHAVLLNGDAVVVKVLRPGIGAQIERDVEVMRLLAKLFEVLLPKRGNYNAIEAVESYGETMSNSLDLVVESANANRFRMRFEDDEFMYVPRVYWELTRSEVMVLEQVQGIPIREIERLTEAGVDLTALADNLVSSFFTQAFYDGFFHGDLHPGNLFVTEEGKLNIVDFGIMGDLSEIDRRYVAENIMAILQRDYHASAKAHIRAGWAPPDLPVQQFELRIRTVCEQVINQPVGQASFGQLMGRLFRMTREFGINIQPQLLLFQKTYLNLEGLVRSLDPNLNISASVRPVLESWMRHQYSVSHLTDHLKQESPQWALTVPELPRLAHSVLTKMQQQQSNERGTGALSSKQEEFYRRVFFTILGGIALIAAIVDWNGSGFGFLTLVLGIAAAVFLKISWPR